MVAAGTGDVALVKTLLGRGADLVAIDKDGLQAWHYAMRGGHVDVATFIEAAGGKP